MISNFNILLVIYLGLDLNKKPVEGFSAGLTDESNLFEWDVFIVGPQDTL